MQKQVTLTLQPLLPWQKQVKQERKRFNVASIGRRAGKTTPGEDLCCEPDVLRYPIGWFAPNYSICWRWRSLVAVLDPVISRISVSDYRIENIAGGVLEFWSMENAKAGAVAKYKRAIIDECAFVPGL